MSNKRQTGFWILIIVAILLTILVFLGQSVSLINFEWTVAIGLQEPIEQVGEVGIAIGRGFIIGDTIIYVPLFVLGIVGLLKRKAWGLFSMTGALAITVYWPVVNLVYVLEANKTDVFHLPQATVNLYMILLPLISLYGLWGMWYLYTRRNSFAD